MVFVVRVLLLGGDADSIPVPADYRHHTRAWDGPCGEVEAISPNSVVVGIFLTEVGAADVFVGGLIDGDQPEVKAHQATDRAEHNEGVGDQDYQDEIDPRRSDDLPAGETRGQ